MAILLKKVNFKEKKIKIKYIYLKTRVKSLPNRPSFLFFEIKSSIVAYISKKQNNTFQGKTEMRNLYEIH